MDIEQKLRMTNLYSIYFLIVSWFTSVFYWFDGKSAASFLRLLLILVVPVIIGWLLREKPTKEKIQERYLQAGNVGAILLVGIVSGQGSLLDEYEYRANIWLSFFFYIVAIAFCVVHGYLVSCYRLFFCNPSVSVETRNRAGRLMRRSLWKMAAIGAVLVALFLIVALSAPEFEMQKQEKTNVEQQESEDSAATASTSEDRIQEMMRQQEEDTSENVVLLILRRVLLLVILLMAIVVIGYALTRCILYFLRRRGKETPVYEEILEKSSDNEEYTRLVPVEREMVVFPGGNDGKVRKRFYREVRRGAGRTRIDGSHTPQELREQYLGSGKEQETLTELYEKARYGEESVTAEELHRLLDWDHDEPRGIRR